MTAADKRRPRRFPFFVVFLIAMVLGGEYLFAILGTFQMQPAFRVGGSQHHSAANQELEKKMNDTVETFVAKIQNQSVLDERLASLEQRIASLEETLKTSDEETLEGKEQFEKLRNNITLVAEQVQNHVEREQPMDDAASLQQRLSSVEERIQSLKKSRNKRSEDQDALPLDSKEPICVTWETDMDEWWTHHPDWNISKENNTHYCFTPMTNPKKAAFFQKIYDIQFNSECSNVTTKRMWSSGWGADFQNVVDGLQHAYQTGIPMQMYVKKRAWHYAGKKDASRPVCESKDMYCFFLNMTRCKANRKQVYEGVFMTEDYQIHEGRGRWLLEYATRQQTWLRHEVYKFSKNIEIKTPCAVMHVRRTDIVLHGEYSRKYRQVEEYVNALDNSTKNILLLTDDQNAIDEAKTLHPDYNWMFVDRPRHRGVAGGWENQIPSDDPKLEVIVLLSIFRLVRQCSSFIHTHSNFAFIIEGEMQDAHKNKELRIVNLDDNNPNLFSSNNSLSVNLSTQFT